jgi:mercuric ion transport protein
MKIQADRLAGEEALNDDRTKGGVTGKSIVSAGSILGALAASSCCILPLALFSLGASGAWIGNLTALAPYQPIIIAITVGFLGTGFYLVYGRSRAADCSVDETCATPTSERLVKSGLWISTALIAAALVFNFAAPILLDI